MWSRIDGISSLNIVVLHDILAPGRLSSTQFRFYPFFAVFMVPGVLGVLFICGLVTDRSNSDRASSERGWEAR